MKAMVFAAGIGTRLRPLTNEKPKALVPFHGKPLLEHVLNRLLEAGVTDVIINLHHFPDQIRDFLARKRFALHIEFSPEPALLDTGGGLKQAAHFFDDGLPFLVHNVDIISNIDLRKMLAFHQSDGALATLAVMQRQTSRYLLFDDSGYMCGWKSLAEKQTIMARTPEGQVRTLAFCGIHVISPEIFTRLSEKGRFSIIQSYLRLAGEGEHIRAYPIKNRMWQDVGKLSDIRENSNEA